MTAVNFTQAYLDKTGYQWSSGDLYSKIRAAKERRVAGRKTTLDDWTVLAASADPYRKDTWNGNKPGIGHVNGMWLRQQIDALGLSGTIHQRGLHYILVSKQVQRPKGARGRSSMLEFTPYLNDEESWVWLQQACSDARWLGYVEFDRIHDARNAAPTVIETERHDEDSTTEHDTGFVLPDRVPTFDLPNFGTVQPYQLVIVGEKSSLSDMVLPIAEEYGADVYLPNGHMSTTHCYQMARKAWRDDRRLMVSYLADCDPWGWFMPDAVARKLQAFGDSHLPGLEWEVHRVGLTPDQVREYGLPSAPLEKGTSRQRERWEEATGTGQTELDAALALAPELLPRLVRDKLSAYFDHGLDQRNREIRRQWVADAMDAFRRVEVSERRRDALIRLNEIEEELDGLRDDLEDYEFIEPELPEPSAARVSCDTGAIASVGGFVRVTRALKDDKLQFGVVDDSE